MPVVKKTVKEPKIEYKDVHRGYPACDGDVVKQIFIHHDPTSNCQLFSIGGMQNMLNTLTKDEDIEKEMVKICNDVGKERCLLDIGVYHTTRIDRIFKDKIVFKQPYRSSNGSDMAIYLIDVSEWYRDPENHDWDDDYFGEDDDDN